MSSASIYYRFKSQKTPSRIAFDGTGLSVWDLKKEIILQNKMGKGQDFDLAIYNADEEEYKDDNFIVPRSTQVIVRRLPPSRGPNRGTAAQYVADAFAGGDAAGPSGRGGPGAQGRDSQRGGPSAIYRGPMTARFDNRGDDGAASSATPAPTLRTAVTDQHADEANKIAAMFQASTDNWEETQERMSHATYRERGGAPRRGGPPRPFTGPPPTHHHSDRPPPIGYICFRCGTKGHWIQDCPTNDDRAFDDKPRFKRTTGIPKSMLKTVEAPTDAERQAGVMVTADGTYVIAQVDNASWERAKAERKPLTRSDVFQTVPTDPSLACPICSKLLREAAKTPCCSTLYCEECIQSHLLEHDFVCAECERRIPDLAQVKPDDEVRKRVIEYVDDEIAKSERKIDEDEAKEKEDADAAAAAVAGTQTEGDRDAAPDAEGPTPVAKVKAEEGSGETKKGSPAPAVRHGLPSRPKTDAPPASDSDNNVGGGGGSSSSPTPAAPQPPAWNPQAVQQIMFMLSNPGLPPPMRMQLQMQLQVLQMQFMQMMSGGGATAPPAMGNGSPMRQGAPTPPQQQLPPGRPPLPANMPSRPQSDDSPYMRLPVNPNLRNGPRTSGKRERPADFLELGGGSGGASGGEGNKVQRMG